MRLTVYLSGAEQPSHIRLLEKEQVTHVGIAFWGLRRRIPKSKSWTIESRLPDSFQVFLDSGSMSANDAKLSMAELESYSEQYQSFVSDNIQHIELVAEFDSLALGPSWISAQRKGYWADIPAEKFMPIWRSDLDGLERLIDVYPVIGIPEEQLAEHTTLAARLNKLNRSVGTRFHLVGAARPDELRQVRFSSLSTSAWLSPARFGETIVWTGSKLARYPAASKERARKRHQGIITRAGFDIDKILADDHEECTRLAIWSFKQLEANINSHRPDSPATAPELAASSSVDHTGSSVDLAHDHADNSIAVAHQPAPIARVREPHERRLLPVVSTGLAVVKEPDGTISERVTIKSQGRTIRVCDSCYLSSACPAYEPGSECAYDLPIEIQSREQLQSLLNAVMEIQSARIMFLRFAEEANGGYVDPSLSVEIDRLFKLAESVKRLGETSDTLRIEATRSHGMLSGLFGEEAKKLRSEPDLNVDQTNQLAARLLEGEIASS